jgi:hypothetical protein
VDFTDTVPGEEVGLTACSRVVKAVWIEDVGTPTEAMQTQQRVA